MFHSPAHARSRRAATNARNYETIFCLHWTVAGPPPPLASARANAARPAEIARGTDQFRRDEPLRRCGAIFQRAPAAHFVDAHGDVWTFAGRPRAAAGD